MTDAPPSLGADLLAAALGQPRPTGEQAAVIESPLVPALVVAGAGSGKTETMAGRVVWLVANGLVAPDEVLGLTFTRKAAGELAERIGARLARIGAFAERGLLPHLDRIVADRLLPAPEAPDAVRSHLLDRLADRFDTGWDPRSGSGAAFAVDRPRIATYNAFADQLVREHAAHIGRDPDAALLTPAASWLIARDAVVGTGEAGLDEVEAAFATIVDAVQRLAGECTDHAADLDAVVAEAERMAAVIEPFIDPQRSRDIDRAWMNLTALPRLVAVVRAYETEKARRGVLDFADQVTGALRIVTAAPQIAADLRDQYRVVLLDEYQDTSVIQTRLLATVFRDAPVMAVGDPNQSIYGWRGASADNLRSFGSAFAGPRGAGRGDLMVSWRNDRSVLDAANTVLRPLRDGLGVTQLTARPGAGAGAVERAFVPTLEDEAETVASWFAASHGSAASDAAERTGAILFRSKRHMTAFSDALDRFDVPHRVLGLGGLLSTPEVTDVVCALRVLHDPAQGSALIRLLVGPRFAVGVADMGALYDIARVLARSDAGLSPLSDEVATRVRASAGVDEQASIIDALDVAGRLPDAHRLLRAVSPDGRARLREAAALFGRLRRAVTLPVPELIRLIETELRLDIELAANESRGSARTAASGLRAFTDAVRAFLDADDRATIGSLLAWLDHAEQTDELMPRTEPPEPGVVQLLTIHGAKGLEWDRVAVVRMVEGELPGTPRSTSGWLGLGELPFALRGDASALPLFAPEVAAETKTKDVEDELKAFKAAIRERHEEEERRLAYVAVTRARSALLLTGSRWSGGRTPRKPSRYLAEISEALRLDPLPEPDASDENPYDGDGETRSWPLDALGSRRKRVVSAAEAAGAASARGDARPSPELRRLLRERSERARTPDRDVPVRVAASRFKDYVGDFAATAASLARPMPERPYRQTSIGTAFHQWVEERAGGGTGTQLDDGLWGVDDEDWGGDGDEPRASDAALSALQENFARSEWAGLSPIEVESEIDFVLPGLGADSRIVICKLDAVYRRGERIEIVDWKTGRPPRDEAEREERMLQLSLYRLAYHQRHGVPLDQIDVVLYYVADDLVLRGSTVHTADELARLWRDAREGSRSLPGGAA